MVMMIKKKTRSLLNDVVKQKKTKKQTRQKKHETYLQQ